MMTKGLSSLCVLWFALEGIPPLPSLAFTPDGIMGLLDSLSDETHIPGDGP